MFPGNLLEIIPADLLDTLHYAQVLSQDSNWQPVNHMSSALRLVNFKSDALSVTPLHHVVKCTSKLAEYAHVYLC